MILQAAKNGADYVKLQTIRSEELVFRERFENGLIKDGKTIAIKSGKYEFITTTAQSNIRRNEIIPNNLSHEILNSGQFDMYFNYQNDNTKSVGRFKVVNEKVLGNCFE